MSSPFKIFRKHQKVLLVVAGLMAMIAFVILPIVLQNFSMRQGGTNPVVVTTTKYGDLKQSDMQNLRRRHQYVVGVMASIMSKLSGYDSQQCFKYLESMEFGPSKDEEMVNRWLMAHRAGELGIQVSDATITSYIKERSRDKLTPEEIQAYIKLHGGERYTEQMFYDDLREELKVQEFQSLYGISITGMPPGQRWDYYCRVHQQAQIECIPVPAAQFAATFKKPSDEVLKDYFEKYKENLPSPYAAEPGFRVPQKIEVEYFTAEVDKFAAPESITDEEIQTYYEKDPKKYDELNKKYLMNETEKAGAKKEPAEKEEGDKKESPEKGKPAEEAKPEHSGAQPVAPEGGKKDGEKKDGEQTAPPAAEKPADKPADKAEEKSSSVEHSAYRFASLTADENKDQSDQPKTETPKADTPAAGGETAASKPEPSPVEPQPADAKPAETKPDEAAGQTPPTGETAAKEPAGATTEKAEPPKRQLTEEVKKEIRQAIAADKILGIFAKLEGLMKENATARKGYEAAKIHGGTGLKEPPKFDFAGLAKQYGVSSGNTGEITFWQARDLDIGKSFLENSNQPFLRSVFDDLPKHSEIGIYTPIKSQGKDGIFLFWKSKDIKETAPKWDELAVQKQVLKAWQLEQARKPALEKAKKLAAEAVKSKATLKEAFAGAAGLEVISPPLFVWLTGGFDPSNPRYNLNIDVKGVEIPGEEFMKTVFSSNAMGVGTALNEPQTIAYVIQVEKFDPTNEVLWNRFKDSEFNSYADAGRSDRQAAVNALFNELSKEAGLKWEPKADHFEKEDSSGG